MSKDPRKFPTENSHSPKLPVFSKAPSTIRALPISGGSSINCENWYTTKIKKTSVKRMGPCQRFACDFVFFGLHVIVTPTTFNMEPEMH